MNRFAVVNGLGSYFNGWERYVVDGCEAKPKWSGTHACMFGTLEDAQRFVDTHAVAWKRELCVVEMMHLVESVRG